MTTHTLHTNFIVSYQIEDRGELLPVKVKEVEVPDTMTVKSHLISEHKKYQVAEDLSDDFSLKVIALVRTGETYISV